MRPIFKPSGQAEPWGFSRADGKVPSTGRKPGVRVNSRICDAFRRTTENGYGHISQFATSKEYPKGDPDEEVRSLIVHSEFYKRSCGLPIPERPRLDRVLMLLETAYSKCVHSIDDDFDSYEAYLRALPRIDRKSSPGFPYCREHTTNGEWLGWDGLKYDQFAVTRLWLDVQRVFETNNADCLLRLFIKNEPHSIEKIQTGRLRIILAAPLHIQMCWHMVFDKLNDLEITHTYHIPSQQGIILPYGGWKTFMRQWRSRGYDVGLDKRAWDWTVPSWLLKLDLELRQRLARGNRKEAWLKVASELYRTTFEDARILMSSGVVYHQDYPGIMKSGCVNTISTNSHMQAMVHILACEDQGVSFEPLPVCCGDDTLQCSWQATELDKYEKYGAIIKTASAALEFVGHEFISTGPIPLYHDKHIMKSFHVKDDDVCQYFDAMCRMYCKNRQMFDFWEAYAQECGIFVKTREFYNYWYDYE